MRVCVWERMLVGAPACNSAPRTPGVTPLKSASLTTPPPLSAPHPVLHPCTQSCCTPPLTNHQASVSKTDQICFDWGRFPMLFKAVSHFNDIIKGPRQKDESLFFVFPS